MLVKGSRRSLRPFSSCYCPRSNIREVDVFPGVWSDSSSLFFRHLRQKTRRDDESFLSCCQMTDERINERIKELADLADPVKSVKSGSAAAMMMITIRAFRAAFLDFEVPSKEETSQFSWRIIMMTSSEDRSDFPINLRRFSQ